MWSKTKKALEDRLADSLKGRVKYGFEVFSTKDYESEMSVFYIEVDKKRWFSSNPMYHVDALESHNQLMSDLPADMPYWDKFYMTDKCAKIKALNLSGRLDVDSTMEHIHKYLNELSVEQCLSNEDYFYLVLAALDRRVGLRKIRLLTDSVEVYPEWVQKWIKLRATSEASSLIARRESSRSSLLSSEKETANQ